MAGWSAIAAGAMFVHYWRGTDFPYVCSQRIRLKTDSLLFNMFGGTEWISAKIFRGIRFPGSVRTAAIMLPHIGIAKENSKSNVLSVKWLWSEHWETGEAMSWFHTRQKVRNDIIKIEYGITTEWLGWNRASVIPSPGPYLVLVGWLNQIYYMRGCRR